MAIPTHVELMIPFLEVLSDDKLHSKREMVEILSKKFKLTPEEMNELIPSGGKKFSGRVGWARTYLKASKLIESPERAVFKITERGKKALIDKPVKVLQYLKQYPEYLEFIGGNKKDNNDKNEEIIIGDDDLSADVTANFDSNEVSPVASGVIGGAGVGGASEAVVRQAEQLDDREKVFPGLSSIDVIYDGYTVDKVETDNYNLDEICVKFRNYLAKVEKLYFDLDTIRYFVSGFGATKFMILEGLSGTGKSSLPRYFAKFIQAECLFIPIQATWRDKTSLVGYFNDFSKIYSETEFLNKLYNANYNPDVIHIFVLDEMNISRVEYYFADFLSVLEYPEDERKLKIMQLPYGFIAPAKLEDGFLQIPTNTLFVGTANKDDSTFTITDKVYDRAITIDFDDRNIPFEVKEEVEPIKVSYSHLENLYLQAKENTDYQLTEAELAKFVTITDLIKEKFDITFGNRILNQIQNIVPVFMACGGSKEDALDFLLSRKVISKIEGRFEDYVKSALKELLALMKKTYGVNVLKRSEKTVESLMRRL